MFNIVITGASRGLGQSLAVAWSQTGHHLHLCGRDPDGLYLTQQQCQKKGASTQIHRFDLTQQNSLMSTLEAIDQTSPIDLLILNAGISQHTLGYHDDYQIFKTNLSANILAIQTILPNMLQRDSGKILVISSLVALIPTLPSANAYHISKQAIMRYTYSLAQLYRDSSVAIQCICPGFISTQMTQSHRFPMPGILSCDVAAQKIKQASSRTCPVISFPRLLYGLVYLLSFLPAAWLARIDLQMRRR
ncbi:MAG: hypothetical protein CMF46_03270 [Legionellales bacterium]|nr:hypothetical protein [Legionellales bacterium]|tara:strand:- start:613 stop:1353 length:741 start_codon:yes stop_codon:yes gene_type:complete